MTLAIQTERKSMIKTEKDIRRFTRVRAEAAIQFYDGTGTLSRARLENVSYGGLCMSLGRYIKPQTLVQVPVTMENEKVSFPARVAWCSPHSETGQFRLGLKADHGGRHTMAILSSWVLDAFQTNYEEETLAG